MSSECLFRGYIKNDKMTSGNSMSSECLCPECLLKFTEANNTDKKMNQFYSFISLVMYNIIFWINVY